MDRRVALRTALLATVFGFASVLVTHADDALPFGPEWPKLDSDAVGEWWREGTIEKGPRKGQPQAPRLMVDRSRVVAFALYTHDHGILKLTAQLYPLLPAEPREMTLEFLEGTEWKTAAVQPIVYPGWTAHFRISNWDASRDVPYRVRLASQSHFDGVVRRDPWPRDEVRVAVLSCNSSRTPGSRETIIENLKRQDPDLLFFAGDQTYHHTQHTFGWLEWGMQFRDILRDRPVVTIPDDHDVGHPNLWGASGRKSAKLTGSDGGYYYPAEYVRMVERCQTWHLPDPVDPEVVEQGIGVYFTRLRVGGIDFAILEDRKFKTGPEGTIPALGPRPDHITDPAYDRAAIDLPGLQLLGERQLSFLRDWSEDWTGASMKCVLSQTAFCGAVHLHGSQDNRLLADLDCNGWPQSGRRAALVELRKARALHLCGDQHLAVVVRHGIDTFGDGPFAFTAPAVVNTIYGRWWHPEDEQAGPNAVPNSPLPWTGDYHDGLGNRITMLAYANPENTADERQRADGHGLVRFRRSTGTATLECWPRFSQVQDGDAAQFPGWPVTIRMDQNDGRIPVGWLPELQFQNADQAVVQVVSEADSQVLYTVRVTGTMFRPPVFAPGTYTIRVGRDRPDLCQWTEQSIATSGERLRVQLP
jgi:3',5'-cyclic AMP phosphodiesterase CpdA